jgi:hypothetical protein
MMKPFTTQEGCNPCSHYMQLFFDHERIKNKLKELNGSIS